MTNRETYYHCLGTLGVPANIAARSLRLAATVARHEVDTCNRPVTAKEVSRAANALCALEVLMQPYRIGVKVDALLVRLVLPNGRSNSLDGETWVIPVNLRA